ncbi:MAG: hypothetical protein AAFV07_19525, partial [Bacteroidota bacterium]
MQYFSTPLRLLAFASLTAIGLIACRKEGPSNVQAERLTDKIWRIQSINLTREASSPTDTAITLAYTAPGAPLVITRTLDGSTVDRDTLSNIFEEWIFTSFTNSDNEIDVDQKILPYFNADSCRPRLFPFSTSSLGGNWQTIPASDEDRYVYFSVSIAFPYIIEPDTNSRDRPIASFRGSLDWEGEDAFLLTEIENDLAFPDYPYTFQIRLQRIEETGCPDPSYCGGGIQECENGRFDWTSCGCACDEGWRGDQCDEEIPCFDTPCENGTINTTDCSCACDTGWTGVDCSEQIQVIPVCDSTTITCVNGSPRLEENSCVCDCDPDWTGPDCSISTALSPTAIFTLAGNGLEGYADGQGSNAQFDSPTSVVSDSAGNMYVADLGNRRIRKIDPTGNVTTYAGSGGMGYFDGFALSAEFGNPMDIAIDDQGNIYVADNFHHTIRKI